MAYVPTAALYAVTGTLSLLAQAAELLLAAPATEGYLILAAAISDTWAVADSLAHPGTTYASHAWYQLPHEARNLPMVVQLLQPVMRVPHNRAPEGGGRQRHLVTVMQHLAQLVSAAVGAKVGQVPAKCLTEQQQQQQPRQLISEPAAAAGQQMRFPVQRAPAPAFGVTHLLPPAYTQVRHAAPGQCLCCEQQSLLTCMCVLNKPLGGLAWLCATAQLVCTGVGAICRLQSSVLECCADSLCSMGMHSSTVL